MMSPSRHPQWTRAATVPRVRRTPAAVIIAALLATAGCSGGDSDPAADPSPTASAADQPATNPPVATAPATPTALKDRIYTVGQEIPAGTYVTTVPDSGPCYWARLRSFGLPDSIIDEGNPEPGEVVRVTVLATDRGFKVANGCTWEPAG